jgi:hypothetical protein
MNRTPVSSSNLTSVGYDPEKMILEIEFKSGSIYQYFNVPESEHNGLMNAESHGKYFNANIKKGGYSYTQLR